MQERFGAPDISSRLHPAARTRRAVCGLLVSADKAAEAANLLGVPLATVAEMARQHRRALNATVLGSANRHYCEVVREVAKAIGIDAFSEYRGVRHVRRPADGMVHRVCTIFEIHSRELASNRRAPSQARMALAMVMFDAGYSYAQIGAVLGRDASTAHRICDRAEALAQINHVFRRKLQTARTRSNNGE